MQRLRDGNCVLSSNNHFRRSKLDDWQLPNPAPLVPPLLKPTHEFTPVHRRSSTIPQISNRPPQPVHRTAQLVQRSHSASTARTERPSYYAGRSLVCASRPTVAQSVQCSRRSLIDLRNAFIGLRNAFIGLRSAFKARAERSTLAQSVHWSAQGVHRSHGRLKSRPRRLPVTLFGFPRALSLTPFGSTIVRDLVHALLDTAEMAAHAGSQTAQLHEDRSISFSAKRSTLQILTSRHHHAEAGTQFGLQ